MGKKGQHTMTKRGTTPKSKGIDPKDKRDANRSFTTQSALGKDGSYVYVSVEPTYAVESAVTGVFAVRPSVTVKLHNGFKTVDFYFEEEELDDLRRIKNQIDAAYNDLIVQGGRYEGLQRKYGIEEKVDILDSY